MLVPVWSWAADVNPMPMVPSRVGGGTPSLLLLLNWNLRSE